jgi:cold shock CspA family protein
MVSDIFSYIYSSASSTCKDTPIAHIQGVLVPSMSVPTEPESLTGHCIWFRNGWGFIKYDSDKGKQSVFVHYSDITMDEGDKFKKLLSDQKCTFQLQETDKRDKDGIRLYKAVNVIPLPLTSQQIQNKQRNRNANRNRQKD